MSNVGAAVELLTSANAFLVEQALQELADIAATNDGIGELTPFLDPILTSLPDLLEGEHEPVVLLACWLLSNLSALGDEALRELLCRERVLQALDNVLRRLFDDSQVKETALWAVTNLSLSAQARSAMTSGGLRGTLTQLFVQPKSLHSGKTLQAIRNFLVDDDYCLEFYESEGLSPLVLLLENEDTGAVELALASLVILAEVLEGLPLELVDSFNMVSLLILIMRKSDEDSVQELSLQLAAQLFLSGEVDRPICCSELVELATQRLNWLGPGVQHRAVVFLGLVSVNSLARNIIGSNHQWASLTLALAASADSAVQESSLRLLANMSVDAPCRRTLREKTNSVKILTALSPSLQEDSAALCRLALTNLNTFDPSEAHEKRSSFREARPSTSSFSVLSTDDKFKSLVLELDSTSPAISYPGDPRLSRVAEDTSKPIQSPSNAPLASFPAQSAKIEPEVLLVPPASYAELPSDNQVGLSGAVQGIASQAVVPLSVGSATHTLSQTTPHASFSSPSDLAQRESISQELLLTETAYVATLNAIQNTFVLPLRQAVTNGKPVLMDSEISTLFSVTEVLCSLHGQFYLKLRDRMSPSTWSSTESCLGDIFFSYAPRLMKAYKPYMHNFDEALSLLNSDVLWKRKEWVHFYRQAAAVLPDVNITGLGHFLIQPLHRVPRYVLLLEKLVEHTPASHPDSPIVSRALEKIRDITDHLQLPNSLVESAQKLVFVDLSLTGLSHSLVDSSRKFVQEGPAFMAVVSSPASPGESTQVVSKPLKRVPSRSNAASTISSISRFRAVFSIALVDMTSALVPDEDPEECKLTLVCGQSPTAGSFLQLNPSHEFSSFFGELTLIFTGPAERDDWLNSISRLRNAAMARVMRARKDSQAALVSHDDVALASANHVLRKPPAVVKRNHAKALEWRDSSVADILVSYKAPRGPRSAPSQLASNTGQAAPPPRRSGESPGKRTKSFGLTALSSVSSVISKARRGASSKKITRLPLQALKGRVDPSGALLESCNLLLPVSTDTHATHQLSFDPCVVSTYRNSGCLCICSADPPASTCVRSDSKVISLRFRQPYVISLHEDLRIQVHNIETDKTEQFSIPLRFSQENVIAALRPRATTLTCDWNRVAVILTTGGVYEVSLFRFSSGTEAPTLSHEASVSLLMPMDLLSRAVYAMVPTNKFCKLDGERLLLACFDQWQMWSLTTGEMVHFDTNNQDGSVTAFSAILWSGDFVAASAAEDVYVWSVKLRQRINSIRTGFIVSSLFLDDHGVLVGGKDGQVFGRSHFREVKFALATELGVKQHSDSSTSSGQRTYDAKVNDLCRIRWRNVDFVVSASESTGIHLWHPESSTLIKHWKSRGYVAVSCAHMFESVRLLVRRRAANKGAEGPADSEPPSFEIWNINLKFLDKWLSEHMDVLETAAARPNLPATESPTALASPPPDDSVYPPTSSKSMVQLSSSIPATFGTRNCPWLTTQLLPAGVLVTIYRGVGSVLLRSESSSFAIENLSPIVAFTKKDSLFISLHQDGTLQVIDSTKSAVVSTFQARPLVRLHDSAAAAPGIDSPSEDGDDLISGETITERLSPFAEIDMERTVTPAAEKERGVVLLSESGSQNILILRSYETRYVIWELQILASTIVTSVRKFACTPPFLSNDSRIPVLRLEPSLCSYWDGYLIVGSQTEIQLWNTETASLIRRLAAQNLATSLSEPRTFSVVVTIERWAFASFGDSIQVISYPQAGGEPSISCLNVGSIITEMLACDDTLFVGTADGMVQSFPLSRGAERCSAHDLLVKAAEISLARSSMQHPSFAVRKQIGVLRRVNYMSRQGRFVFAGHEGNCISVWSYDPNLMSTSQPVFVKEYVTRGPVLQLQGGSPSIYALTRGIPASGMVGIDFLALNVSALLTAADISSRATPAHLPQTSVVTFTAANPAENRALPSSLDEALSSVTRTASSLRDAVDKVRDLISQGNSRAHDLAPSIATVTTQLEQVLVALREISSRSVSLSVEAE